MKRYVCIGAFIQCSTDTVCAFYSISPSTALPGNSHAYYLFISFDEVFIEHTKKSISCRVFELKFNAMNHCTPSINSIVQSRSMERREIDSFLCLFFHHDYKQKMIWNDWNMNRKVNFKWMINVSDNETVYYFFSHFLSFFFLFSLFCFFIASSYVCWVSLATVPCLLHHFTYRLLLLLCIRQPIVIFCRFVSQWSCHFHRENGCFLYILACSITMKCCCCFFSFACVSLLVFWFNVINFKQRLNAKLMHLHPKNSLTITKE